MGKQSKFLVVGASGFIGRAVVALMVARGMSGIAVSRNGPEGRRGQVRLTRVASYEDKSAVSALASGCEAAIMLAGRAHVLKDEEGEPSAAFMLANRDMPVAVAEAAALAGVRRFVFVSSIAVHGPGRGGQPLRENDPLAPATDYGRSKLAGERALERRCHELGLELVIIRPPLVYGPEAPGNFGKLLRAAKRGLPLPLGSVHNRRDFIGVENLADLLLVAAGHPAAAGQTFLVSDGEEVSTTGVASNLYAAFGHRRRLLHVPVPLLGFVTRVGGRADVAARLLDDLRIDSSHVRRTLGWQPPLTVSQGLDRSARGAG